MTKKEISAKIERSSLGTPSARAARRTVTAERAGRVVANAAARQQVRTIGKKSGG